MRRKWEEGGRKRRVGWRRALTVIHQIHPLPSPRGLLLSPPSPNPAGITYSSWMSSRSVVQLVGVLIPTACVVLHPVAILTLQEHNKPVEPPKQLRPAPFFLPTLPGLQPKFIPEDEDLPPSEVSASKIVNLGKLRPLSEFQKCLLQCAGTKECERACRPFLSLCEKPCRLATRRPEIAAKCHYRDFTFPLEECDKLFWWKHLQEYTYRPIIGLCRLLGEKESHL